MLHEGLKSGEKYAKCVEQTNEHRKLLKFEVEDMVWVHLNTDIFMAWKFGRLKLMIDGPFNIIENIGENAYNLEPPNNSDILHTSNVKDLRSYHGKDLRASFFSQLWGIDAGTTVDPQFCPSTLAFYPMGVTLTYRSHMAPLGPHLTLAGPLSAYLVHFGVSSCRFFFIGIVP